MEKFSTEKKSVVISGVNGFVGRCLADTLYKMDVKVIGIGRDKKPNPLIEQTLDQYYSVDLTEYWPKIKHVDAIINLAGLAAVGASFDNPQKYINNNTSIVTNMCEHYLSDKSENPRILIVSSGAVYSDNQKMPITEKGTIDPSSPYALSKIMNEEQAKYYRNRGLDCIVARPFNHIGVGQSDGFILPDLYNKIQKLKPEENIIKTGNLETKRDYTDVRDIARAYGFIALKNTLLHDTYNICSGNSFAGKDILEIILSKTNHPPIACDIDSSLIRPKDIMQITGDSTRLQEDTGWHPEINIHQTISDFIESQNVH